MVVECPEVSAVLPMYNEAPVAARMIAAVSDQLAETGRTFEIVCVDDGSTDDTGQVLYALADRDPRILPVRFSRNFGKEAAISAGLEAARGRAIVVLDADLQHPPQLIPEMLQRWAEGYDVVNGVKGGRGTESPVYGLLARLCGALMARVIGRDLRNASDFKLLDRAVVDVVLQCPERNRFFRGLVAWAGFRVTEVPFDVAERATGRSKWTVASLVGYTVRNLVAYSAAPLRLVAWVGLISVSGGAVLAVQTLYNYLLGKAVTGFTTVILLLCCFSGLILLSLGIMGVYLSNLYEEQKARPLFVIKPPSDTASARRPYSRGAGRPNG